MSIVYMTREVTPESLVRIYRTLGVSLPGNAAVKISTGEPGSHNFLWPELVRDLVQELMGAVVECNTAYEGRRDTSKAYWGTMRNYGFIAIAPCNILDEEGHVPLPVTGGHHLTGNYMGSHLQNHDSTLMFSHFKGHAMGGFGGTLGNMSIGSASPYGEIWVYSSGTSTRFEDIFTTGHDSLLESMASADRSVIDYMGHENIVYINMVNHLSVDCDCDAHPHNPEMGDISIFASADPIALDQACVDAVYASEDDGKAALIEHIESQSGIRTVGVTRSLNLSSRRYKLRCIDSYKNWFIQDCRVKELMKV